MMIVNDRRAVSRWYYVVFGVLLLATGNFGGLLTMHIRWRGKAPNH